MEEAARVQALRMTARQHHYVPACYLSQFGAPPGERTARLRVFDRKTGVERSGTAGGEARVRDFYAINHKEPNIVETKLAEFEGLYAKAINSVVTAGHFPDDKALNVLTDFIAIQAVRVPGTREWLSGSYTKLGEMVTKMYDAMEKAPSNRVPMPSLSDPKRKVRVSREDARTLVDGPDQSSLVLQTFELAAAIGPVLWERRWVIGVAPLDVDFVTGDNPVSLIWAGDNPPPAGWHPGFGREDTNVILPLSNRHVLIGTFRPGKEEVRPMSAGSVSSINSITALTADRWVFAKTFPFKWYGPDGITAGPHEALKAPTDPQSTRAARRKR